MRRHGRLAALLGGVAGLAACFPRPPAEPPIRIVHSQRQIEVAVETVPAGLAVYAVGDDRRPGARIGQTPLVLDRVTIGSEIWKHGAGGAPPPPGDDERLALEQRGARAPRVGHGEPLRWSVVVDFPAPDGPRLLDLELRAEDLATAFSAGRMVLLAEPGRGQPVARPESR